MSHLEGPLLAVVWILLAVAWALVIAGFITVWKEKRRRSDDMAGGHIEREARYTATGLSPAQRDERIWQLYHLGWSQRQIMKQVGMTQAGVSHALKRLKGIARKRATYRMCAGECGDNYPIEQLDVHGLCGECREEEDVE